MTKAEDRLAHLPVAALQVNATHNWRITGVNNMAGDILGYTPSGPLLSMDLPDLCESPATWNVLREALTSPHGVTQTPACLRRHDGALIALSIQAGAPNRGRQLIVLIDNAGSCNAADIFEQSPIAIEQYDAAGRLVNANQACLDLFGVATLDEILGFQIFKDPNVGAEWKQKLANGEMIHYEHDFSFDKVRQLGLYKTSKTGMMRQDVMISPLWRDNGDLRGYLLHVQDITERFEALKALGESEEKYRQLFATETEAIMIFDAEAGRFLDVNSAAIQLFGYTHSEFLALSYSDITAEKDASDQAFKQLQTGQAVRVPLRYYRKKDGTKFPTEISASTMTLAGRTVMCGAVRDITERVKVEEELHRSETKFRTLYDSSSDAVMLLDGDHFSDCNNATIRIFGCKSKAEFCALHPYDLSPPEQPCGADSMTLARERIATAIKNGTNRFEWMHKRHDTGEIFPAEILLNAMDLAGRKVLQAVVRDITERKQAEETLRISEEKYRQIVELSPMGIATHDLKRRYLAVNPAYCRMFGRSEKELIGKDYIPIKIPERNREREIGIFDRLVREQSAFDRLASEPPAIESFENINVRADGQEIMVHYFADCTRDKDGRVTGFVIFGEDVTERKKIESETLWYQERLQALAMELSLAEERERKRLAVALHDDLVQLLSVTRMRLTLLEDLASDPATKESLAEIAPLVDRAVRFIRSMMLQLSHPALYEMGLVAAAEWLAEDIRDLHNLNVTLSGFQGSDPLDQRTRVVLFQCMRELLMNVTKHAATDHATVRITHEDGAVRVTVEDGGVGFDPKVAHVSHDATKFGLFSIRERIRLLGGQVAIRSAPGKGTTAVIDVPIVPPNDTTCERETP